MHSWQIWNLSFHTVWVLKTHLVMSMRMSQSCPKQPLSYY